MAPKGTYSRSRMAACAAEAAAKYKSELPNRAALEDLTCDYIHAPDETNMRADGSMRRTAQLTFRWRLKTNTGHEECCDVTVRTNKVPVQGVPLPSHWTTAMRCLGLNRCCEESAGKVRDPNVSDVRCLALGQAKEPPSYINTIGPGYVGVRLAGALRAGVGPALV